jgi:DNA-directed RNA polymerase subunit RPC12/RpoP
MWGKPTVKLKCDSCKKDTEIDIPDEVECTHCNETLKLKGRFIKGLGAKAAVASIIVGGLALGQVDGIPFLDDYPSSVQYAIINTCIAGDQSSYFSKSELKQKKVVCICAFDKTKSNIGYDEFKRDENYFIKSFHINTQECD